MAHRGKPKNRLPLPTSWSFRKKWEGSTLSMQELALSGKFPRPGTKGHLQHLLLAAGWEAEEIESKALEAIRPKLFDLHTEGLNRSYSKNIDALATSLRKKGLSVNPVTREKDHSTSWVESVWDSLSSNPWWSASHAGKQSMVLVSSSQEKVTRASALFVHDVWTALGGEPEHRMPVFRRINLITLMNPESLSHFMSTAGKSTDLLVVYGGFLNEDSLYENFSYLSAVRSDFKGFLLYEAVVPMEDDPNLLAKVSRRSGFPIVLGVN